MTGKDKCRMLRQIRINIAQQNDITYITQDCKYKGACKGTCPKCESEVRYLEEQLEKRRAAGKRIALAGISVSLAMTMTGCALSDRIASIVNKDAEPASTPEPEIIELDGETEYTEDLSGIIETTEGEVAYETDLPDATEEPELVDLTGETADEDECAVSDSGH